MPSSSAARITSVPFGHGDLEPVDGDGHGAGCVVSTVMPRCPIAPTGSTPPGRTGSRRPSGAAMILVAEVLDRRGDRSRWRRRRAAQNARPMMLSQMSQQLVAGPRRCPCRLPAAGDPDHPVGALPARRALAARLVLVELGPAQHGAHARRRCRRRSAAPGCPSIDPAAATDLEVQRHVQVLAVSSGVDEPPGGPELQRVPGRACRRASSISSRSVMPSGASYWPGVLTCPDSEKIP